MFVLSKKMPNNAMLCQTQIALFVLIGNQTNISSMQHCDIMASFGVFKETTEHPYLWRLKGIDRFKSPLGNQINPKMRQKYSLKLHFGLNVSHEH